MIAHTKIPILSQGTRLEEKLRSVSSTSQNLQSTVDKLRIENADLQRDLTGLRANNTSTKDREVVELRNKNELLQRSLEEKVGIHCFVDHIVCFTMFQVQMCFTLFSLSISFPLSSPSPSILCTVRGQIPVTAGILRFTQCTHTQYVCLIQSTV